MRWGTSCGEDLSLPCPFMSVTHSMAFMVDFIHSVTGQQQQPRCWLRHVRSQITIPCFLIFVAFQILVGAFGQASFFLFSHVAGRGIDQGWA